MKQKTTNELRCFCSREPLLAVYGVTDKGKIYIHIKVYKQSRIYAEAVVTEGTVQIHCRECLRWHTINIRQDQKPVLKETTDPAEIVLNR